MALLESPSSFFKPLLNGGDVHKQLVQRALKRKGVHLSLLIGQHSEYFLKQGYTNGYFILSLTNLNLTAE